MSLERRFGSLLVAIFVASGVGGLGGHLSAAQGWYLLNPPFQGASSSSFGEGCDAKRCEPDLLAPLRSWRQYKSYDTAKECELEKTAKISYEVGESNRAQAELKSVTNGEDRAWKNGLVKMSLGILIRWQKSLCIASDDPRLK